MKQAAFARLIDVTPQMVSKYAKAGHVVLSEDGSGVDAASSLDALEGHLAAEKLARARTVLKVGDGDLMRHASAARAPQPQRSGKALKEDIDAELRAIDLAERKRELVAADDVDARARDAVALFRESRANGRRELASRLCAQFAIPSDRAPAVTRFLAQEDEASLGVFARALAALIADEIAMPQSAPADVVALA